MNVRAAAWLSAAVLPGMQARRFGRIINIGSEAGVAIVPGLAAYCASNGRRPAGVNWEVYGDPAEDPAQTRTDIYFLLGPAAG